jgi:hypothetical protein
MAKLIIHQPKNFESRFYRYYNIFFDKLIEKLKLDHDIIDCRYFKYANSKSFPFLALSQNTDFNNTNIHMLECEMVIEDYDTKRIKILSVADDLTGTILNLQNSEFLDVVLVAQYNHDKIQKHLDNKKNINKYSPWIYFPQSDIDFNLYYEYRQSVKNLVDKFYFRGTSLSSRPVIYHFDEKYFQGGLGIGNFDTYAKDLLKYKVGYSVSGRGEFCYRDIEYMAMGIPFIRFEYTNKMHSSLIPNFHYISIPRIDDLHESQYTKYHAQLIETKFLEIKDNQDLLNFISNNAREYYLNHIHNNNGINYTISLLNL